MMQLLVPDRLSGTSEPSSIFERMSNATVSAPIDWGHLAILNDWIVTLQISYASLYCGLICLNIKTRKVLWFCYCSSNFLNLQNEVLKTPICFILVNWPLLPQIQPLPPIYQPYYMFSENQDRKVRASLFDGTGPEVSRTALAQPSRNPPQASWMDSTRKTDGVYGPNVSLQLQRHAEQLYLLPCQFLCFSFFFLFPTFIEI